MTDIPEEPISSTDPELAEVETESDVEHYEFKLSKTLTRRIDQYLVDRVPYLSRAAVQRLIDDELVTVNGKPCKASYKPHENDRIVMVAPPKPCTEIIPEDIPLDIIYEDEHLLALNKQAGLMVHPARGKWTGTLVNGLVNYGKKWSMVNGNWRPGILHRLDRNTTGIMLVAKSDEAHWRIARQFERRTIQKTYMAICHGVPELESDVIDMPIGRDRYHREKQSVRKVANGGREAVTIYKVEQKWFGPAGLALGGEIQTKPARFSLVRLTPKTGRTHQLRVHMSAKGYPMVGDTMYGGKELVFGDFKFSRQALHAAEITFVHPGTLKAMTLQAPLPEDFVRLSRIFVDEKE